MVLPEQRRLPPTHKHLNTDILPDRKPRPKDMVARSFLLVKFMYRDNSDRSFPTTKATRLRALIPHHRHVTTVRTQMRHRRALAGLSGKRLIRASAASSDRKRSICIGALNTSTAETTRPSALDRHERAVDGVVAEVRRLGTVGGAAALREILAAGCNWSVRCLGQPLS